MPPVPSSGRHRSSCSGHPEVPHAARPASASGGAGVHLAVGTPFIRGRHATRSESHVEPRTRAWVRAESQAIGTACAGDTRAAFIPSYLGI
jgi:hypothetical protein